MSDTVEQSVKAVREAVRLMRAEMAGWDVAADDPGRRFFVSTIRLIEMAADDAAAVEAMNARTRERAERVGGDGHTWVMHRPEWSVALKAAQAYSEVGAVVPGVRR